MQGSTWFQSKIVLLNNSPHCLSNHTRQIAIYSEFILGSSLDKESSSLELEFEKYSVPLYYPKEQEIFGLVLNLSKTEDPAPTCLPLEEVKADNVINFNVIVFV